MSKLAPAHVILQGVRLACGLRCSLKSQRPLRATVLPDLGSYQPL